MRTCWEREDSRKPRQGPECGGGLPARTGDSKPKTPFFWAFIGVTATGLTVLFGDLGSVDGVRQKADLKLRPATPHREVSRFERFAR